MSVEAHFWVTPGVEVFPNQRLPYPPPRIYRVAILPSAKFSESYEHAALEVLSTNDVALRLTDWGEGGEVAHYELDSQPRAGYRWIVVDGELRVEKA